MLQFLPYLKRFAFVHLTLYLLVRAAGFEPATLEFRIPCSAAELRPLGYFNPLSLACLI